MIHLISKEHWTKLFGMKMREDPNSSEVFSNTAGSCGAFVQGGESVSHNADKVTCPECRYRISIKLAPEVVE